ncbi:hypothetical protein LTR84_001010 [Exophiala bonariae]|uniref:Uncharacterized protein n=1 Tax=Exophiala bonariae TaxID=1690606 RepID=A0AAV9NS74_9EURO|nr:hypothetical protein LTR84_001010 [Exophiala bonariae]
MAEFFNGMAIDQPAGTARHNSHAADSWLEPWLIKHVSFYRKHMTKDGKAESHATRRHSVVSEALKSRENSVAEPAPAALAAANLALEQAGPTAAVPSPVEEPRESEEQEAQIAARIASDEGAQEKDKPAHSWRRSIGWMPHP